MRTLVFTLICSALAGALHAQEPRTTHDDPLEFRQAAKDRSTAEAEVTEQATSFCEKNGKQLKIISLDSTAGTLEAKEKSIETSEKNLKDEARKVFRNTGDAIGVGTLGGAPANHKALGTLGTGPRTTTKKISPATAHTAVLRFHCE